MTIPEFSDQFDVLYNNITSNQAPGLNEYEKSLFLTKAEKEIVKNHFSANSQGNTLQQGFDDSAKRQADFSVLMKTQVCTLVQASEDKNIYQFGIITHVDASDSVYLELYGKRIKYVEDTEDSLAGNYVVTVNYPTAWVENQVPIQRENATAADPVIMLHGVRQLGVTQSTVVRQGDPVYVSTRSVHIEGPTRIDPRSTLWEYPEEVFIPINETVQVGSYYKQVIPLRYDEYIAQMSKPYKRPLKNQVWRLMNSGVVDTEGKAVKTVEIIAGPEDEITNYSVRFVRVPKPIIVGNLEGLTIDGVDTPSEVCEIDPILHEDILQRAVELAKIAWTATGQDNLQAVVEAGKRSE